MKVENAVVPTDSQLSGFTENDHGKPIYMVNLLKFKQKADYSDGRKSDLSGAEAYAIYGAVVSKIVENLGGEIVFGGNVERLMLGQVEELWDQVAIAKYPNRQAMLDMVVSPEYGEIAVHREAGLAGQLNIETTMEAGGS